MDKKQGLFGIKDGIYLIIAPLAIILPISYWYFTAPPPGFCAAQNRYVTDEEYIKLSTNAYHKYRAFDGKSYSLLNCCVVERIEGGFWSKVFRIDEGVWVNWRFERNGHRIGLFLPGDVDSFVDHKFYQVDRKIDACATTILDSRGTYCMTADESCI